MDFTIESRGMRTFLRQQVHSDYVFQIPSHVSLEQVLSPNAWMHHTRDFHLLDVYTFIWSDPYREVDARIIQYNEKTGFVKFIATRDFSPPQGEAPTIVKPSKPIFDVGWNVGKQAHYVTEIPSGRIVADGFKNKADAEAEALKLDQERKAA